MARDLLDDLLKDAKRQRHFDNLRKAQELAKLARAQAKVEVVIVQPPRPRYQLEAQGWYENRAILIMKENRDHSLTPLGVYIELLHANYPSARRLVPCPSMDIAAHSEVVRSWGDARPRPEPYVETQEELDQIRNRFKSLLEELDEEDGEAVNGF